MNVADQILEMMRPRRHFCFFLPHLNSAEVLCVPMGGGGELPEGNTFSFGSNGSEYSVGYECRAVAFGSKICFRRSVILPNA
jgi:hypothetical protein